MATKLTERQWAILDALPGTKESILAEVTSKSPSVVVKSVAPALRVLERMGLVYSDGPFWLPTQSAQIRAMLRGPKRPDLEGAQCGECPLLTSTPVLADIPDRCQVLFVGEAPGETEANEGRPFIGRSGKLIRSMIRNAAIQNYGFANTCSCHPPKNETPKSSAVACCSGRLRLDILRADPKIIVALGNVAAKALGAGSLAARHGMPTTGTGPAEGYRVLATYHPAAVLRDPTRAPIVEEDLARVKAILDGKEKLLPTLPTVVVAPHYLDAVLPHTLLAVDIENTGIVPPTDPLSIAFSDGERCFVSKLSHETVGSIAPVFADPMRRFLWHNGKFDCRHLHYWGITEARVDEDTYLATYALDERRVRGLEYLVGLHLGYFGYKADALHGTAGKARLQDVDESTLLRYNGLDAYFTYKLFEVLHQQVEQTGTMGAYKLMCRTCAPLLAMEGHGMVLDVDVLEQAKQEQEATRAAAEKRVLEYLDIGAKEVGAQVAVTNPNSSDQLGQALRTLGVIHPDKQDHITTNATVLANIYEHGSGWQSNLCGAILNMRKATRLLTGYCNKLPSLADPQGRVHTKYNLTGAGTGRLSSGGDGYPNLQNVAGSLKRVFTVPEGYLLLNADLSQAEIRTLASFVHDAQLDEMLSRGVDSHSAVASLLLGVPLDSVTKDQRKIGKTLNFGILYGMGDPHLATVLGCSTEEAHELKVRYFARFPRVLPWKEGVEEQALKEGYVEYSLGRRRHFAQADDEVGRAEVRRQAVNSVIQGTAADILCEVLCRLYSHWRDEDLCGSIRFVNTVHDSMMFELLPEYLDPLAESIREEVARVPKEVFGIDTPYAIDVEVGLRWGEMVGV